MLDGDVSAPAPGPQPVGLVLFPRNREWIFRKKQQILIFEEGEARFKDVLFSPRIYLSTYVYIHIAPYNGAKALIIDGSDRLTVK